MDNDKFDRAERIGPMSEKTTSQQRTICACLWDGGVVTSMCGAHHKAAQVALDAAVTHAGISGAYANTLDIQKQMSLVALGMTHPSQADLRKELLGWSSAVAVYRKTMESLLDLSYTKPSSGPSEKL